MNKTIYALGFFDGVHLGHQALLTACCSLASRTGCVPGAVTFGTHPDTLVQGKAPALINTIEDRKFLLHSYTSAVVVLPFDKKMQAMPWQDFLGLLQEQYGAAGLVCGQDFRFGSRGEGNAQHLAAWCKEKGLAWAVVPQQRLEGTPISSTHIRSLLEQGNIEEANRFLGHPHFLMGKVAAGRGLGRTLGIPTANLELPEDVVQLPKGVYVCKALVDGRTYPAVTNIGSRPTVGGHQIRSESWLLDFDGDLYGKTLMLEFYQFLRPEKKFDSLEALQGEILQNAQQARQFFESR